jgi:hypothetical protein
MANIPSHMRISSDLIAERRARQPKRASNTLLVVLGLGIGAFVAAMVLSMGLVH